MNSSLAPDSKVKPDDINSQRLLVRNTCSDTSKENRQELPSTSSPGQSMKSTILTTSDYSFGSTHTTVTEPNQMQHSSSEVVTRMGRFESDMDHWMHASCQDRRHQQAAGRQPNTASSRGILSSFWYTLALLPVLSGQRARPPCSPGNSTAALIIEAIDAFAIFLNQLITNVRTQMSLVSDQVFQACFSIGMDVVLALHALAFIALSVYQALQSAIS